MQDQSKTRRPAGTGSLFTRADRAGRKVWDGKWREGQRQVKRKIGPVRQPGSTVGLTRREADAELRELLSAAGAVPVTRERLSLSQAGERYIQHVDQFRAGKRTTVKNYRIVLRKHMVRFFATRS